jgi:hypothetical protein
MERTRHRALLWAMLLVPVVGVTTYYLAGLTGSLGDQPTLFRFHVWFFGFFTIFTNLMTAVWAGWMLFGKAGASARFARRPSVQAAVSLYVFFVGLGLWAFLGGPDYASFEALWQWVGDLTTHTLAPLLGFTWFFVGVPRRTLRWNDPLWWMTYPAAWYLFWMVVGPWMGSYPYPFMDVSELGLGATLAWAVVLVVGFLTIGYAFVGLHRLQGRRPVEVG